MSPEEGLKQFDPTPSSRVITKMRFFFQPYNPEFKFAKHMQFEATNQVPLQKEIEKMLVNPQFDLATKQELKDYLIQVQTQEHRQQAVSQWKRVQNQVLHEGLKGLALVKQNTYKHKRVLLKESKVKRRQAVQLEDADQIALLKSKTT